jgi:uncharacterized membrane protein
MEQALAEWAEYVALIVESTAVGWEDIGFLAAIAAIRTFLNYFLEKDIEETRTAPGRERIEA